MCVFVCGGVGAVKAVALLLNVDETQVDLTTIARYALPLTLRMLQASDIRV